jgi:hypothetical protein
MSCIENRLNEQIPMNGAAIAKSTLQSSVFSLFNQGNPIGRTGSPVLRFEPVEQISLAMEPCSSSHWYGYRRIG